MGVEWDGSCPIAESDMIFCRLIFAVSLVLPLMWADTISIVGGSSDAERASSPPASATQDTLVISLPVPPRKAVAPAAPATPPSPPQPKPVVLPPEFRQESAMYLQRQIGTWTLAQARDLLGEPLRKRPSFDDDKSPVGQIYAFPDPSSRYKEVELDFDTDSGLLHGVFVYPVQMTWQDCRRQWGASATATEVANGRTFYSYSSRRLDVLVERGGKVVSLGLY
jgi:hypothetical protein